MFRYIKGRVTGRLEGTIILENHGIGYEISMPLSSSVYLASPEEEVTVYTFMAVREDAINLYGFDHQEDLEVFLMLTTVSGIGNKAALSILSTSQLYLNTGISVTVWPSDAKKLLEPSS